MLQFLYPVGLLAAAGILIPVIIHLWNIKNGKTIKVGSISLMVVPARQRSRSVRINDWPLLLLRCLLILLTAFLIAAPVFKQEKAQAEKPGWILVEKQGFSTLWAKNKTRLEALIKKGFEIRDFNAGFTQLELKDTATVFSRPAARPLSYFSLIRQLDAALPAGTKVYLYTDQRLNRFEGDIPASHLNLSWMVVPFPDKVITWPQVAVQLNDGSITQQTAVSTIAGTVYHKEKVRKAALPIDTGRIRVLISNQHTPDAAYIKAAVLAIADYTQRRIEVKDIQSLSQIKKNDVVFWLAALTPAQISKMPSGITLLNYAGAKAEKIKSLLIDKSGNPLPDVSVFQRIKFRGTDPAVWKDSYGVPLLTRDHKHYTFYSRFNQNWTNLVWTNELVTALLPLIIPEQENGFTERSSSLRIIDHMPELANPGGQKSAALTTTEQKSLSALLWWLLLLVFLTERLVSYRKNDQQL